MNSPEQKRRANADKQRRFRERQRQAGKKEIRGYVDEKGLNSYQELANKSGWTDSELLNNALRITYAAYKCGQIKLLSQWLKERDL
ncbi:hypothetical protein HMF8227_01431 [Saliniradius amylolyticus]|uniref:Uncharacterized protein n=1 Tax=Saliniradius amylolyticus TaxID=2183582 RepID=A0A2S2E2M0_9ALTE|nr:hypothetical protein [Saliniradius amylolyticus]AWL11906.1 hypothetical protein HMF8227_01431 [Saliniradius amylolyticus]